MLKQMRLGQGFNMLKISTRLCNGSTGQFTYNERMAKNFFVK
jgi:hypothetical protein